MFLLRFRFVRGFYGRRTQHLTASNIAAGEYYPRSNLRTI